MKTHLGQNFLTDESVAKRIVSSAGLSSSDNVLEIGPGRGILTKYLIKKAGKILAIEIDAHLVESLQERFDKSCYSKIIQIIKGDVLKINLLKLIEENNFQNYKVVANLPYYITSPAIRLLLETKCPPAEMILMVQKEVGERIIALDGKESILSISVKFYAEPEILFRVSRENFSPVPEVDSVVIKLKRRGKLPNINIREFFSLVRAGFSSKRKMLVNNLSNGFHMPKKKISEVIKKAGLEPGVRAERLRVEDWVILCRLIGKSGLGSKSGYKS